MYMDETYKNCLRNMIIDNNQYSNGDHNTQPVGIDHPCSIITITLISYILLLNLCLTHPWARIVSLHH